LSLALQAASSATSTSTTPTIQASFAKEPDFFNSLLEGSNHSIPFAQLETWATELSISKAFHEPLTIMPRPKEGKKGEWRPIGMSGRRRTAQQLILRDVLSATVGDSPNDSTVKGAGGERALFEALHAEIENGYLWWASLDVRDYFPSLRPGHLAGFPLSKWMIQNLAFLPPETSIRFIDPKYGIELSEQVILEGDDADLPLGYPYSMGSIGSKLKMVRQGLIQGDVCAPQFARMVLGRELRRSTEKWDVVWGTHLDNILIGARAKSEAKASIQALAHRLMSLPAGPLELHEHEIRHINDHVFFLGYRVSRGKDGTFYTRPALERFDRLRTRLLSRLGNSIAYEKQDLVAVAVDYARRWFAGHPAWDKSAESWHYVMAEVHWCVNRFILDELTKGIGNWHIEDLDQDFLPAGGDNGLL
ncbi:hypothetical protein NKJ81_31950, partial [Mesorhizobium sp. M0018]|uniref:hypothetical protein n=1 Tax=Mesorhizobium sp. M0018 TaxID=2956844 RepID=UPI003339E01D